MRIFVAALLLVALCVIGLCFNIIFRKNGKFPDTEIESNENMKKLGIKCVKAEEMAAWRKSHGGAGTPACHGDGGCASCEGCSFYKEK